MKARAERLRRLRARPSYRQSRLCLWRIPKGYDKRCYFSPDGLTMLIVMK